uniref:Prohead core protein n=1 Tax=viral metagenome TaxID=1070528 RepID=A0A6C0IZQ0_9ZZZZ|tara:strand:- start:1012 stop:1956 length:945 start_codon:yes stop_codon:yes gene_type:complete
MSDLDHDEVLSEDDESLEETQQMPVGTEDESIKSVEKAEVTGKKQKARKGDKLGAKDQPKDQGNGAGKPPQVEDYDFSDDLNALVENEQTLSDEFKAKTAIIFETAINSKVSAVVERLENEYQEKLEEELESTREDLIEKVDNYLNYVVEQWMEENQIAVAQGLRTEVAEEFMGKLKDLFVESYIEVPESKVDLVDELAEQVEELEAKVNEQVKSVMDMTEQLEAYQREAIVNESARDLADTQIEKLRSLVSSLDFVSEESFSHKVKTVKESYFKKEVQVEEELTEDWSGDAGAPVSSSTMDRYLSAIKKTSKE